VKRTAIIGLAALAGAAWWWTQRGQSSGVEWGERLPDDTQIFGGDGYEGMEGSSMDDVLFNEGGGLGGGGLGVVTDAPAWLRDMAGQIVGQYFPSLDLEMVLAICKIESSFGKNIYRDEPKIGDASVGMMQTLVKTAQWLHDIGYKGFPYPSAETLKDPATSIYFGCAMLKWLTKKGGSEEETVRAYNGGWGGRKYTSTLPYWKKYLKARGQYA
jgi:hypothetical protein